MSGIFGIWNRNGRPVDESGLTAVRSAMAHWGPDGAGINTDGAAGLGHLALHNTPESAHESLPTKSTSGQLLLTCTARLDNRDDLFRRLRIPAAEWPRIPDSRLILLAWEKWGTECPRQLLGDWAFAVWDRHEQELFLARDQYGHTGLYYYDDKDLFVFASSMAGVLAAPGVPFDLNPEILGQMNPGRPRDETTPYRGVHRLSLARSVRVRREDIIHQRYWHPSEAPDVRFRRDQEYVDAFLDLYTEAVRCRTRSLKPAGVTLSGGLDSGSTAALAAQHLKQHGHRLKCVTAVPAWDTSAEDLPGQFGDERPFVELMTRFHDNIDVSFVTAKHISPIQGIRDALNIYHEPLGTAASNFWLSGIMEEAQKTGIGTLMTGQGGNLTASWAGNRDQYLNTLLRSGRLAQYMSEILTWKKDTGTSLLRTLTSQVGRSVLPGRWIRRRSFRRSLSDPMMLRKEFVRTLQPPIPQDVTRPELNQVHPASAHRKLYTMMHDGNNSAWYELGAAWGINVTTPVYDIRLMEFCLGIPQEQYTRGGQRKLLIRRAMKGLMPDKVLWNNRKGKQSADIIRRLRVHRDEFHSVLEELRASSLASNVLDLPRMTDVFEKAQVEVSPELSQMTRLVLMKGIMIGLFLQRFDGQQQTLPAGTRTAA